MITRVTLQADTAASGAAAISTAQPGAAPSVGPQTPGGAAYVPRAGGPPDTRGYMWIGYAVSLVLYSWYIVMLLRRHAATRRALNARG